MKNANIENLIAACVATVEQTVEGIEGNDAEILRGFAAAYVAAVRTEFDDAALDTYCDLTDKAADACGEPVVTRFFFDLVSVLPSEFRSDCGPFG